MLFSSWQFVALFLPITLVLYFWLNGLRLLTAGKVWLVAASLFFYAYWDPKYLPLILGSILFNYAIGTGLAKAQRMASGSVAASHARRRAVLAVGIVANLAVLGYYKYTGFFLGNLNALLGWGVSAPSVVLPLAISFFTFTQIVYLVDSYRGETAEYDLLNYTLFVTFFPHLIAGPIVHHRQIMPQFHSRWTLRPRSMNLAKGLFIFSLGLFKKVVIADTFAVWADAGFDGGQALHIYVAWVTSLSYSFQLYFDFSGYCDMAVGASLLFNIWLPINFNSPYKAVSIQDFWRRWHITLSHFLRDYLYIPLGGNRSGPVRTHVNVLITFALGGLWHGATWMFVIWGALHGMALVTHRLWQRLQIRMPQALAWLMTFLFVNATWVFFRAKTLDDALRVLRGMVDWRSGLGEHVALLPTVDLAWAGRLADDLLRVVPGSLVGQLPAFLAIAGALMLLAQRNSMEWATGRIGVARLGWAGLLFVVALHAMLAARSTVFLYFNF